MYNNNFMYKHALSKNLLKMWDIRNKQSHYFSTVHFMKNFGDKKVLTSYINIPFFIQQNIVQKWILKCIRSTEPDTAVLKFHYTQINLLKF